MAKGFKFHIKLWSQK